MSQGSRYFESGLWPEKISQKRNHGWGPIGEVRIFNMVTFLLKVRSNCLSNEKQVIKKGKNDNMKQQEKSGYHCCYFDKNRQERYQQKKKYFNSKKRSRVVVLNSNAHQNHRGCLFKVQRLSLWVVLCWDCETQCCGSSSRGYLTGALMEIFPCWLLSHSYLDGAASDMSPGGPLCP